MMDFYNIWLNSLQTKTRPIYFYRALRKHLLSFLVTLVNCLSQYTKDWRLDKERIFIGDLAYALSLNLDLADNPQFYDLPVLETSLVCLTHITAQPHWSLYCNFSQGMSLCIQLMTSLVQVIDCLFPYKRFIFEGNWGAVLVRKWNRKIFHRTCKWEVSNSHCEKIKLRRADKGLINN